MDSKLNTGIIQLNKVRCNFTKCLRVLVSFVWFIHSVTKIQKPLHLNTSHVFHHVTENGIQNCTSMSVNFQNVHDDLLYYQTWKYLQHLLQLNQESMGIGATAKHVE